MNFMQRKKVHSYLRAAIPRHGDQTVISHIPKTDVQSTINAAWQMLDETNVIHSTITLSTQAKLLRKLCLKLAAEHDVFPSTFHVVGVIRTDKEAFDTGSFADIYHGRYQGADVVLKRPRIGVDEDSDKIKRILRDFCRESLLWSRLNHPHVLPFLGVSTETFPQSTCMVLPCMANGNLRKRAHSQVPHLQLGEAEFEPRVAQWLYETALGLDYLHEQGLVHGAMHCGNLLMDDRDHVRLTDFGFTLIADATPGRYGSAHGGAGAHFMAPEFFDPEDGVEATRPTKATDIYAFGCTCIELYRNIMPWEGKIARPTEFMIGKNVSKGKRPDRPLSPHGVQMSQSMWDMVEASWAQSSSDRLTSDALVRGLEAFVHHK